MKNHRPSKIEKLIQKGVIIPNPLSVDIGPEVDTDRISGDRVAIYSGCKIYGSSTLILRGTKIGYEGPVTIDNCQIGPLVELKGGFFKESVFLKNSNSGPGSHIREGTIFEEGSRTSHTVGLKQTVLFPFVTLGSLINFCDCLMSGGTSPKDHSEVGSSYIHFNYTPNQDKTTPTLLGDVPRGVMLNQRPIFLGGQGGIVGPCRLEFGTIIAAGSICRKDELRPGRLMIEVPKQGVNMPFVPGMYRSVKRVMINNIIYIANLVALMQWYDHVRSQFISDDFSEPLFNGLTEKLDMIIDERIARLCAFSQKMPGSAKAYKENVKEHASALVLDQKNELYNQWSEIDAFFSERRRLKAGDADRDIFLENIHHAIKGSGKDYIRAIKSLSLEDTHPGTRWLQGIVDTVTKKVLKLLPSFSI